MRVAVVSTPFCAVPPKKYGGTELFVHALCEGLVEEGIDVTLYATRDSHTSAKLRHFSEDAAWPPETLRDLSHSSRALTEIARGGFDVVHANSAPALAFSRLVGAPCIYTIHHDDSDPQLSRYYAAFPNVHFVPISDRQRSLGIVEKPREAVHHGLIPSQYPPRYERGSYLLYLGRIARVKGVTTALDCAASLGMPLRIAGEPHEPERSYFELEVLPRILRHGASHIGEVGGDDKLRTLREAAVLLFPIEWEEPFGLVMIEAALCGTPVVAYRRGAAAEVIEDGVTGYLVAPGDFEAFCAATRKATTLDRRACRAAAREKFGHRRMARDYLRIYAAALREADYDLPRLHMPANRAQWKSRRGPAAASRLERRRPY